MLAVALTGACALVPSAATATSAKPCSDGSKPWTRFNTAYPVPFAPPRAIPTCRLMAGGTRDEKPAGLQNDHFGSPLPLTAIKPNRRWALADSYGTPFAYVERTRRGTTLTAGPRSKKLSRRDRVYVQGKGCMSPHSLQGTYALVKVGKSGVRAFIERAAFGSRARSIPFDSNSAGCGKPRGTPTADPEAPTPYGLDFTEAYAGDVHVLKTNGKVGTKYADYALRAFAGPTIEAVSVSSTGVSGGGVYRSLVEAGDTFRQLDHFGYVDPAVKCGQPQIARWVFGEVIHLGQPTGIYGFIPRPARGATGTFCP